MKRSWRNGLRSRIHRRITLGLQLVLLLGLVGAVLSGQWLTAVLVAFIIGLTFFPLVLGHRYGVFVPPELELLAVFFIFATLFLGTVRGYYLRFVWWDALFHAGSGFLLGIVGFLLVHVMNQHEEIDVHMKPGFVALFAFVFAVAGGAVWEIFEFSMDSVFGLNMQKSGLVDTMWDLMVDTGSAGLMAWLGYGYLKADTDSFLEDWITDFVERNPHLFHQTPEP